MAKHVILTRKKGVATITLNRPNKRNVIDYNGWLELLRVAIDLESDETVRVVIITGAGDEAFSAGADIRDLNIYLKDSQKARGYADAFEGAMNAVEALSKPTICLIKGFCMGGGCMMSTAADLRIAADNSRFGIPVAHLGNLIGYDEMRRLVNLVGPGNASYILLTGGMFDAAEAFRIGLVNYIHPLSGVDNFVYGLASEITQLAPLTQSRVKHIMKTVLRNPSLTGLSEEEKNLPFTILDSEDFQEGRQAFLEKRKPKFKGR